MMVKVKTKVLEFKETFEVLAAVRYLLDNKQWLELKYIGDGKWKLSVKTELMVEHKEEE